MKNYVKDNPYTNSKINQETDHIVAGPVMETDRAARAKPILPLLPPPPGLLLVEMLSMSP